MGISQSFPATMQGPENRQRRKDLKRLATRSYRLKICVYLFSRHSSNSTYFLSAKWQTLFLNLLQHHKGHTNCFVWCGRKLFGRVPPEKSRCQSFGSGENWWTFALVVTTLTQVAPIKDEIVFSEIFIAGGITEARYTLWSTFSGLACRVPALAKEGNLQFL